MQTAPTPGRVRAVPSFVPPQTATLTLFDTCTGEEIGTVSSSAGEMRPAALEAAAVALARGYLSGLEIAERPGLYLV